VETPEQLVFLMENRCDVMQGFLFSRPLSASDFITLVERESRRGDGYSILRQLCPPLDQGDFEFGPGAAGM
jgi:hypothetical protein